MATFIVTMSRTVVLVQTKEVEVEVEDEGGAYEVALTADADTAYSGWTPALAQADIDWNYNDESFDIQPKDA